MKYYENNNNKAHKKYKQYFGKEHGNTITTSLKLY